MTDPYNKQLDGAGLSHFMSLIKKDTAIVRSASGERSIVTEGAADLPLLTLSPVVGESIQNGTPTPSAPVYIQAVRPLNYTSMPSVIQVVCEDELIASVATEKSGTTTSGSAAIIVTYPSVISKAKADEMLTKTWVDSNELWIQYDVKVSGAAANPTGNLRGMYTGESGDRVPFQGMERAEDGSIVHRWHISSDQYIAYDNSTNIFNSGAYRNTDSEWHTVLYKLHPQYLSGQPWVENATTTGGFSFTLVPTATGAATYTTKNLRIFTGRVTLVDLKGHELHGLDSTYYDQLDIDASGHAVLTKRTGTAGPEEFIIYSTLSDGTRCRSSRALAEPPATNNTVPIIKSNMHVPLRFSGGFVSGKVGIIPRGRTDYGGAGTLFIGMPTSVTTKQELLDNYPSLNVLYPLPESSWHTIDLGYVDLPQVSDGGTVRVAAEVQPIIGGTWWTKAGYSTGKLMQDSRDVHGKIESPYTEVEWVESNGKQFVYLDWKPKIATWGFEADFIIRNAFDTTQAAWNAATNKDHSGSLFGTQNSSQNNDIQVLSYSTIGYCRIGGTAGGSASTYDAKWKKDQSRQTMKLHGTTLTRGDGSTLTVVRSSEVANKPYANMTVFAYHSGLRRSGYGSANYPGSVRIYSLKFYDSDTLECDLVGAIRKSDGVTGLYDKVAGKFYPAPGCTYGNVVGDLGKVPDISSSLNGTVPYLVAYNDVDTRMLRVNAPTLDKLEDGQSIRLTYLYAIGNSYQTTELAGWDDTSNNSNVYIKLTLSDGSTTEWIPCYYNAYTHLTTHYYAGSPLLLTYRENVFIGATATSSGTAVMRGFWVDQDFNTNTTANNYSDNVIAGLNGVGRYTLCMRDANDNWTKIVNENNKAGVSDKTAYAGGLRLGKIIYHNYGSDISAGSNTGSMLGSAIAIDLRYSLNGIANAASTTLQFRKPVYLVGTVNATDGLFYLDQTKWWSQELPISDDGKVYILLGWAYGSYYAAYLSEYNPAYAYKNGHIQELTNGHVVQKDVPANAVFTDTTALGSMTGTLGVAHGGTGQTSGVNAANYFLNELSTGSSDPVDNDYYISQYVNGGTTTTTYHRRPVSKLWNYIKGKISSVLGLSESGYTGNAATATTAGNVTGTIAIANGGTGAISAANARTNLGVPPTSHAASATTYGAGTGSNYGHVKLSDATDGTAAAASGGTAATPKAVSDALTAAKTYADGKNNQNAFSNVKVGSTTVAADTTTDTVELAGSNVTLTPDATNDKVTIGITASNVTTALGNTAVARATADASGNNIASTYTNLTEFNAARTWYATCDTAAGTAAKVATITPATTEFTLEVGRTVYVKFANTNSAAVADISLSVNGTTAKHITYMYNNTRSNIPAVGYIVADFIYQFVYDGTYWCIQNMHYNTNSTYNLGNNQIYNSFKVKGAIAAESIAVGDASGYIQAAVNVTFDLSYRIVWVTKALTTSSTGGDLYSYEYSSIYDRNLATRHGFSGGTAGSTVYLYGTVSGATMTLGSTYLTTTQPVTEDGKCYIPIGKLGIQSTGANYFYFNSGVANTVYMYVEGAFRQIDPYISSGLVTGTLPISRGGTGATTAAAAWTALGGGAIGKKASLAASDIPNLSTDKLTSGTLGVARGGTGATTAAAAWTALGGGAIGKKASLAASDIPSHASTATTYGVGTNANYGHLKLSDSTSSSSGTSGGIAATPSAVKAAYDIAHQANEDVGTLGSMLANDIYFTTTYSISGGVVYFEALVYLCGEDITDNCDDSAFSWYYRLGTNPDSALVSLGTGKEISIALTSIEYGGSVIGMFDDGN